MSSPVTAIRCAIVAIAACSSAPALPDAPNSAWSNGTRLPLARLEPGVTALGQQLVVLDGFDTGLPTLDVTTKVDVLDVAFGTWSSLRDAPVVRHHVQLAAIGTTLYLLGGLDGRVDGNNEYPARGDSFALDTLDPTATWRTLAPIPIGLERGSAAVVVAAPRIYLLGGAGTTDALASNIYYDVVVDAWCPGAACPTGPTLPDLPVDAAGRPAPRSHLAGMRRIDGTLVVTGGLAGLYADTFANDTWSLSPGATQWVPKQPMPDGFARGGCAYGVIQGQLVCAGGEAGTSALSSVVSYDPIGDTWTTTPPSRCPNTMPDSRAGTQGAAIGQRLFVPGGADVLPPFQFQPTDTLYIYAPLDTAGCP